MMIGFWKFVRKTRMKRMFVKSVMFPCFDSISERGILNWYHFTVSVFPFLSVVVVSLMSTMLL